VTPTEAQTRLASDLFRFTAGRAAMLIHTRRIVPTLRQTSGLSWDVAPLPIGTRPANVLHSDAFCLAAGAADKEAAWSLIEFAVGPEGQTILAETGRTVPSLPAVAESDAFLKGTTLARALGLDGLGLPPAIARPLPSITSLPSVEASFDQGFKRVFYDGGDVATAAAGVAEASRGLFGDHLSVPRFLARAGEIEAEE
jgi:multiple sugar transport system substrate-binding protein